jgi:two-component sensor histidine kinase
MNSSPIRLLFIDDDPGLGRLVQKRLAPQSIAVEHVNSGEEGLVRLAAGGIDAVALDQNMPGVDGLQTLPRILAMPDPPPVVFVTASEDSRIAVAALKAGAADYVTKDIQGEFLPLLKAAVESALETTRLRRAKESAEAEVRAARDRFEALAAERAMLLREVNHRVGNSLQLIASMLHMQGSSDPSNDVKAALTQATHRVMAVAQVHRRLYTSEDVQSVAVDQYLESLVEDLRKSADSPQLAQITLSADPAETEPDRAVAVGIIVNELVTNALKYAYPSGQGPIRVYLKVNDETAIVSVEDDGAGYTDATLKSSTGLGQRIVKAMADKLGAEIQRNSSSSGTKIQIGFALSAPKAAAHP